MHELKYIKPTNHHSITPYCACGWLGKRVSVYTERYLNQGVAQDQFVDHLRELEPYLTLRQRWVDDYHPDWDGT